MNGAMTARLVFDPLVPWPVLWALAGVAMVMLALALWRGLPGWFLRGLGLSALLAALAGPNLQSEDRQNLSDIVILLVDDSASQGLRPLPLSAQPEGDGHRIDERHLTEEGASGQGEHRQIQHVRLAEPIEQGRQRQNGNGQQQGITEPLQGLGQDLSGVLNWHKGAVFCDVAHILLTRTHLGIGASPFIGPFLISDQTIGEPTDPGAGSAG